MGPAPEARSLQARLQGVLAAARGGDAAGAVAQLEGLLPEAVEAGRAGDEAFIRGLLGQLYAMRGQTDRARPHLERARDIAEASGQADAAAHFTGLLDTLG